MTLRRWSLLCQQLASSRSVAGYIQLRPLHGGRHPTGSSEPCNEELLLNGRDVHHVMQEMLSVTQAVQSLELCLHKGHNMADTTWALQQLCGFPVGPYHHRASVASQLQVKVVRRGLTLSLLGMNSDRLPSPLARSTKITTSIYEQL